MGPVTRRLNTLWQRQTHPPLVGAPKPGQSASRMFVKVKEPLRIGSTALPPGTYILRPSDVGGDTKSAQILNADQTELIATFSVALDN
jgi:hypothetical protein